MTEILIGRNDSVSLDPRYGKRHDMIAEAVRAAKRDALRGVLGGIFSGGKR